MDVGRGCGEEEEDEEEEEEEEVEEAVAERVLFVESTLTGNYMSKRKRKRLSNVMGLRLVKVVNKQFE